MINILDCTTLQIDVTTRCEHSCSNCHHLVNHHKKVYDMTMDQFRNAIDSLEGFPKQIGLIGGDPLLWPHFEEACELLRLKFPVEQLGLWTCLPEGKERFREIIVSTFHSIFLNDHSRNDVMHNPTLVASEEMPFIEWYRDYLISHCWLQEQWSPSIVADRAYFCETAGCLSLLLGLEQQNAGWPVEKNWWTKSVKHYREQIDTCCKFCGQAMPLKKRASVEGVDDISPKMHERLKLTSPKLKAGKFHIHDLQICNDTSPMATYKDTNYRDAIAARFGLFLSINAQGFQSPHLYRDWKKEQECQK